MLSPRGPRSDSAASLRALVDAPQTAIERRAGLASGRRRAGPKASRSCSPPPGRPGCRRSCRCREEGIDAFTDWAAEQFGIGPGTVVANYAPLNFDLCLLDIWTTLKHGGCVVLVDQDRATQSPYLPA